MDLSLRLKELGCGFLARLEKNTLIGYVKRRLDEGLDIPRALDDDVDRDLHTKIKELATLKGKPKHGKAVSVLQWALCVAKMYEDVPKNQRPWNDSENQFQGRLEGQIHLLVDHVLDAQQDGTSSTSNTTGIYDLFDLMEQDSPILLPLDRAEDLERECDRGGIMFPPPYTKLGEFLRMTKYMEMILWGRHRGKALLACDCKVVDTLPEVKGEISKFAQQMNNSASLLPAKVGHLPPPSILRHIAGKMFDGDCDKPWVADMDAMIADDVNGLKLDDQRPTPVQQVKIEKMDCKADSEEHTTSKPSLMETMVELGRAYRPHIYTCT
jgi:hypothetical protein